MPYFPERLSALSAVRNEYVILKGSVPYSVSAFGIQNLVIPHNLGYAPYVKAWYDCNDGKRRRLFSGNMSYDSVTGSQIDNEIVDATNYTVSVSEQNGGTVSGRVYYRIYAEPQT
jgi:hypothetical protein